jgi:hypothetical protein
MFEEDAILLSYYLSRYLCQRFNCRGATIYPEFNKVFASGSKYNIMLRLNACNFPKSNLVIARICFKSQRKGNGTDLLRWILQISEKYGYENICLEFPNAGCIKFGEKFGFIEYMNSHLLITKSNLKKNLHEYNCSPITDLSKPVGL